MKILLRFHSSAYVSSRGIDRDCTNWSTDVLFEQFASPPLPKPRWFRLLCRPLIPRPLQLKAFARGATLQVPSPS